MAPRRTVAPLITAVALAGTVLAARQVGHVARRQFGMPPRRPPVDEVPAGAVDVAIDGTNGLVLRGWLLPASGAVRTSHAQGGVWVRPGESLKRLDRRPAAVVMHGWGSSAGDMLPVAAVLTKAGLHAMVVDARCHGRSDGDDHASMPRFAEDIESAVRWLRGQSFVYPDAVVLVGHSVGAGAALFAATRDPRVAGVVSVSSMANPAEYMGFVLAQRGLPSWVQRAALRYVEFVIGYRYADFAPERTIARVSAPVLLVHGDADQTVPIADAYRLQEASAGGSAGWERARLIAVEGAGHTTLDALLTVADDVLEFVREAVRPALVKQWERPTA